MAFYCYKCGGEVRRDSGTCPHCGVRFKAVKCPRCDYLDEAEFFKGGCPNCGYLAENTVLEKPVKKKGRSFLSGIPARIFILLTALLLMVLLLLLWQLFTA